MSLLARRPSDLDVPWAQGVLERSVERAEVRQVRQLSVDVGTTTRVRLEVDHDQPSLPRRWFVKLPSRSFKARAITFLPQLPQTEVRCYRELGLPVRRPRVLLAETGRTGGFTLALADLEEAGGRAGRSGAALTLGEAGALVEELARLHAGFWQSPRLDTELSWLGGPVRRLEDRLGSALALPLTQRGLRKAGELVPPDLRGAARRYAWRRRSAMARLQEGAQTVVHHDCHPGNLFWDRDGGPGLLDWQLIRLGVGVGDVAYLLATGLEVGLRRSHERELVERYAGALRRESVVVPEPSELFAGYQLQLSYPFEAMLLTLAVGGLMEETANRTMLARAAAAAADHEALQRVLAQA